MCVERSQRGVAVCVALVLTAASGCDDPIPPDVTPASLAVLAGDGQEAIAGTALRDSIVISVRNKSNEPVSGAVTFRITTGGGTVSPGTVTTGADGRARAQWSLGTGVGEQTMHAAVSGAPSVAEVALHATSIPGTVASIAVTPDSSGIVEAKSLALTAKARDRYGNEVPSITTFAWATDSPTIATVSASGMVRGVSAGTARISATAEGRIGAARITVTRGVVSVVTIAPTSPAITIRDSVQLSAKAFDADGEELTRTASWASSDRLVATASSRGVVIGTAPGTATITASVEGTTRAVNVTVSPRPLSVATTQTVEALAAIMDRCHTTFSVYTDVSAPCSHFHAFGKIPNQFAPVTVNGSETTIKHSGATAIKFALASTDPMQFGGYYMLVGRMPRDSVAPIPDFGTVPNAGYDLTGATELTFWARGASGGELIDFFVGGVGRSPVSGLPDPLSPHPESTPVAKIRVSLTTQWQQYSIPLTGMNLSYMLGGFGWSAGVGMGNPQGASFYVDDIEFQLSAAARSLRLQEPRFLTSFLTRPLQPDPFDNVVRGDIDFVLRNTAFAYDNALTILAFLATGSADGRARAELIGQAFVYAAQHDRSFTDGRIRTAYTGGDLKVPPAWTPNGKLGTVTIPGFYVDSLVKFYEVEQHAADVGNNAWVMIALLALHRHTGKPEYLATARLIGAFIQRFASSSGAYAGFLGGIDQPETTSPTPRQWASVEHNLDVHAAFSVMFDITGDPQWSSGAARAKTFVEAMWDAARDCNLAGTDNGNTRNQRIGQLPVDVQAWYVLAVRDALVKRPDVLQCAERQHRVNADGYVGFDFNDDRDGVWFEGTAHMATAYTLAGQPVAAETLLAELRRAQLAAGTDLPGGMWASSRDGITTGFDVVLSPTQTVPFELFRRIHVGATAWHVFGAQGVNPYYIR